MANHFTRENYLSLQERLNSRLDALTVELADTLKQYEKDTYKFENLKIGWELVIEWLSSLQRWPEIDTFEDLDSNTGCKVLYVNSYDFARLKPAQLSRYPYIVIKEGYPQSFLGGHLLALKETFDAQPQGVLNIQTYATINEAHGKGKGRGKRISKKEVQAVWDSRAATVATDRLADMIKRATEGTSQPLIRSSGKSWNHRLPWNFLNLDGHTLDPVTSPASLHQCLRMLYTLCGEIKQRACNKEFGKLYDLPASAAFFADVQSCMRFLILGEKGTFSGNHLDILAGTWILGLSGLKLWWVFTGEWTAERKADFVLDGASWNPGSLMQLLPIEAGDYAMMMPGHLCAHAPFSVEDCLMTGGMFWNDSMIPQLLENISWICEHNARVSNEGVPRQLINVLSVLGSKPDLTDEVKQALLRIEDRLRPLLSCSCKDRGGCKDKCACAIPQGGSTEINVDQIWWRSNGCTAWCDCNCKIDGKNNGRWKKEKTKTKATKRGPGRPKKPIEAKKAGTSPRKKRIVAPRTTKRSIKLTTVENQPAEGRQVDEVKPPPTKKPKVMPSSSEQALSPLFRPSSPAETSGVQLLPSNAPQHASTSLSKLTVVQDQGRGSFVQV